MSKLEFEMTDAELFALDMIAVNKQDWVDNFLTNRARVAKDELKSEQSWGQAIVGLAGDGGDVNDDWAVLIKGRDLGLFKTAGQKQMEIEVAQSIDMPAPETQAEGLPVRVLAHALALKIGAVNALRTDGGEPYPATIGALATVRDRYTDTVNAYNTKVSLGDAVTGEETVVVRLIQQGFALFAAIDDAAETIIQSGDVADPVAADPRWPQLGG